MMNTQERVYYKWDDEQKNAFLNDISRDSHILHRVISDGIDRNCEPDDIVSSFTQFITDRANPYFEKRSIPRKIVEFNHINRKEKQKWYNTECKRKRKIYKEAVYNFNLQRNHQT